MRSLPHEAPSPAIAPSRAPAADATGPMIFTPEYYRRMRTLEASGWWNAGMRASAARVLAVAGLPETGRMLDVGCGSGQTMAWFRRLYPGWTALGIDLSAEAVRAARHFGERAVVGSATRIPAADGSFDLILTLDVLQHLPLGGGDRAALAEARRVLRPGGGLFIRTNAQAFPRTEDDRVHDFHKYRTRELATKLADGGFEVVRLSRINALLGLAEIPRELRASRQVGLGYHGILAGAGGAASRSASLKRAWLELEGRLVAQGWRLPAGRTHLAFCRAGAGGDGEGSLSG